MYKNILIFNIIHQIGLVGLTRAVAINVQNEARCRANIMKYVICQSCLQLYSICVQILYFCSRQRETNEFDSAYDQIKKSCSTLYNLSYKSRFSVREFDLPNKFRFVVTKQNCSAIVSSFKKFVFFADEEHENEDYELFVDFKMKRSIELKFE